MVRFHSLFHLTVFCLFLLFFCSFFLLFCLLFFVPFSSSFAFCVCVFFLITFYLSFWLISYNLLLFYFSDCFRDVILHGVQFISQRVLRNVWKDFWFSQLGGCYRCLLGLGQGYCWTSHNAQCAAPTAKVYLAKNVTNAKVKTSDLRFIMYVFI